MNLKEIRTKFVEKSGRFDLVVDRTNYVDNGANFFIQTGQRILDSIMPTRKDVGRYVKTVEINQSSMILKHIRAFDSVYVTSSGNARTDLDRKTYSWMLEQYGDDFGAKATGIITFTANPAVDDTITIGSETYTFKTTASTTSEITIGSDLEATIDNIASRLNTSSSICTGEAYSSTQVLVEYYLVGTAGNSIVFTNSCSVASMNGSGYLGGSIAGRANQIDTGKPLYWAPVLSTPHPSLTLSNMASLDTADLLFGLDRYAKDGIMFMPPADEAYTITINAYFFSLMTSDADISYHSEMYPELLIMATNLALEMFYRNTQGVNDWLAAIRLILQGIDRDLVIEEMVLSGHQMRG